MADNDPRTDETPHPDPEDATPPHGDAVVNDKRNASRHSTWTADDPDSDRPSK